MARRAGWQRRCGRQTIRFVRDHGDACDTFRGDLRGILRDRVVAFGWLSAGHRHGIVDQQLVGDARARRDGLANRHDAGMRVGAVAHVGEHVRRVGERGHADERRALAAHLGEGAGLVALVERHEMTADAGGGEAAIRQARRGAVRAAGAEGGSASEQAGRTLGHTRRRRVLDVEAGGSQEAGEAGGDDFRRQFHQRRQQRRAGWVGLAADLRTRARRQVVERVANLRFDEAALLLDHQDRALAAGERAQSLGFQRPGHRDLVERDLRVVLEVQHAQRVQRVVVRAADGDDADRCVTGAEDAPVEPVGARPGERGGHALLHHAPFQFGAVGGEAQMRIVVQPVRRQQEVRRDERPAGRNDQRGRLFGGLGGGLQRDPQAAEARQRDAGQAEIDDVLRPRPGSAPG